jgi:hypothetical protein
MMLATKIPVTPVKSSNIHAIGYDPETQTLAVHFKSGAIWHFAGVRPDLAAALRAAPSKGKLFVEQIRGRFTSEKMSGSCAACGDVGFIGDPCLDCSTQRYARDHSDGTSAFTRPMLGHEV